MSGPYPQADLPAPARALAIGAHPDDIEFGAGATLAKWAASGCEVHLLVLTDGSKGTWDEDAQRHELVDVRMSEQRAAAQAMGAAGVHFAGQVDGELQDSLELRGIVCSVIRETRPDVVLGHDPWKRYRLHPDHRHAGFLTIDAVVAARDHLFFPEQSFPAHRPSNLLLFEAQEPDHVERVDESHVASKVGALLAHRSQWRSTMGIDEDSDAARTAFAAHERRRHQRAGALIGAPLGEAFKRIDEL